MVLLIKNSIFAKMETQIIFNDSTDYDAVLEQTKIMFLNTVARNCDCGCDNNKLCEPLIYITAADLNKEKLDQIRYEEAVESAYLSIKCNC